jgi:hypothetical protein
MMFILTEKSENDKYLTLHVFKLYNQLSWQSSYEIQEDFEALFNGNEMDYSWPVTFD